MMRWLPVLLMTLSAPALAKWQPAGGVSGSVAPHLTPPVTALSDRAVGVGAGFHTDLALWTPSTQQAFGARLSVDGLPGDDMGDGDLFSIDMMLYAAVDTNLTALGSAWLGRRRLESNGRPRSGGPNRCGRWCPRRAQSAPAAHLAWLGGRRSVAGIRIRARPSDLPCGALAAMSDAPSIETLLGAATQAESKRDGDSLYAFAQVAREAGACRV